MRPVYSSGVQAELVTPTGAAIVRRSRRRFAAFPEMKIEKAGYGAGSRDFPGHPNVVRLTVGEAATTLAAKTTSETITVLEANLDDLNPQVFGYVMDRLLEEGALDVFGMPVQMKKNRPGTLLTVLCKPEDREQADTADLRRDHNAGRATSRRSTADAGAALGKCAHPMGRSAHQDCQHEWNRHQLRARIRRLPAHRGRTSCTAENRDAGSGAAFTAAVENRTFMTQTR